jgi:hypothetical protein
MLFLAEKIVFKQEYVHGMMIHGSFFKSPDVTRILHRWTLCQSSIPTFSAISIALFFVNVFP